MKNIVFITVPKRPALSGRFIVSTIIGFKDLGWNINWIGTLPSHIDLAYNLTKEEGYKKLQISELPFNENLITNADIIFIDTFAFDVCDEQSLLREYGDTFNKLGVGNKLFIHDSGDRSNKDGKQWPGDDFAEATNHKSYTSREPPSQIYCQQFCGMSIHKELYFGLDKRYYICSIFNSNFKSGKYRKRLSNKLQKTDYYKYVAMDCEIAYEKYITKFNQSQIGISAWGNGFVCYRDFEIMSCNCILAYTLSSKEYLSKLEDMKSCITYQHIDELLEKIKYLHGKDEEIKNILNAQNKVIENNYLPHHRALKVIKLMGQ